jgi:hypothetical protein
VPFESPATRFDAELWNATTWPSAEIEATELVAFP